MKLRDAIGNIFSINEDIFLWRWKFDKDTEIFSRKLVWCGLAHEIPEEYLEEVGWEISPLDPKYTADIPAISIMLRDYIGLERSV